MKKVKVTIEQEQVLDIEMITMFCRASYSFGSNPLPVLRRKLPIFEWDVVEWQQLSDLIEEDAFLVCAVHGKYFVVAHLKVAEEDAYMGDKEMGQLWSKSYWQCKDATDFGWELNSLKQELESGGYWVGGINLNR
jgi:hypothetical protein